MDYKQHQRNNFKYIEKLKSKPTEAEKSVMILLEQIGERYIFQKGFLKPFHRIVDFYIPKKKIIIEVDGGYHKDTREKDFLKDKLWLEKRGMKTIRITNEQILNCG